MSLLMDALKKAEQEKKAAAERLREAQGKSPEDKLTGEKGGGGASKRSTRQIA